MPKLFYIYPKGNGEPVKVFEPGKAWLQLYFRELSMATLCMILNTDAEFRSSKINSVTKGIVNSVQVRLEPVEIKGGNNFCHKLYCSL